MGGTIVRLLVVSGSQALVLLLVARTVPTDLVGQFTVALVVAQSLALVLNLGFGASYVYMACSGQVEPRVGSGILFGWWATTAAGLWLLATFLPASFLTSLESLLGTSNLRLALLLPIGLLSSQILLTYFHAERRFLLFNGLWSLGALAWLVLTIIGCQSPGITVGELLALTLTAWLLGACVTSSIFVLAARPAFLSMFKAWRQALAMARHGVIGNVGLVLTQLNNRADLLIVAGTLGDSMAAVYGVAAFAAETVNLASGGITTVLYPSVVRRLAAGEASHDLTGLVFRLSTYASVATAVLGFLGLVVLQALVLPEEYAAALAPMALLVSGTIVCSACRILAVELSGLGRFDLNCWAAGFALGTNVILTGTLAPRIGLLGAALGSVVAYWIQGAILLGFHHKLRKTPRSLFLPSPIADFRRLRARIRGEVAEA